MSVFAILPTARPAREANIIFEAWKGMGYYLLGQVDPDRPMNELPDIPVIYRPFKGWAESINYLSRFVFDLHDDCDWVVAIGDDCMPDLARSATTISKECSEYFGQIWNIRHADWAEEAEEKLKPGQIPMSDFGVMNPTGDRYGGGFIDNSAAHPWLGREWCKRMYRGRGPLWPEYQYWYGDTELQDVAIKHGVFWQRRDLKQEHKHYSRTKGAEPPEHTRRRMHLVDQDKALYEERKRLGFPGSAPLE